VRNMPDYLTKAYGLWREEACVLCSGAADLRIHEVWTHRIGLSAP
jgi:acetamidase/formamidase